jgi:hypothetical protein
MRGWTRRPDFMVNATPRIVAALAMLVALSIAGHTPAFSQPTWVEQGPGPILFDSNTVVPPNSPVSGAINAIATSPTDPDLIYVATVNGGIWRTTNATADSPTWIPLTDQQLPALSINSLATSPVDAKILFAGTGSTSSLAREGSSGFGVARSTDGGDTWTMLAESTFTGRQINSIVPAVLHHGMVVLAATLFDDGGVFRSTDLGSSFTRLSGDGTSGLPDQGVSSLVADRGNPKRFDSDHRDRGGRLDHQGQRFYAAVPALFAATGNEGVYRSDDGGVTWTAVNTGLIGLDTSLRILLAVHSNSTPHAHKQRTLETNAIYAAIISNAGATSNGCPQPPTLCGHLQGVFRSDDGGESWTALGVPAPEVFPGGQGNIHGAILAHPTDPNVVFIAGDRQNGPFPNASGCTTFNANIFRGDAAKLPGNPWQSVVCNGANGTAPHADSRAMVFDTNCNLVHADDGGIYRLLEPDNEAGVRRWVAINGDIRAIEIHSIAYDPLSNIVFGGTQDNGAAIQLAPGESTWAQLRGGDGGNVAVDSDQTAHPGTTIRYTSSQFFGAFNRTTWDAANTRVGGLTLVQLRITSGPGTGLTLFQDPNLQFYQPYVLNAIDPSRMLIGTANIYESLNRGDALANLGFTGFFIGDTLGSSPLAYGGRLNGEANPDVFYVGAGPNIFHRVNIGDPITTLSPYPGARVRTLVIDPQNYQTIYVVDFLNRVWASFDEGASWLDLTANLASLSSDIRAIEVVNLEATNQDPVLLVGGLGGVFQMPNPGAPDASWTVLSSELPHGFVRDLHYNPTNDLVVAGLLGRGAWTLTGFFQGERQELIARQGVPIVSQGVRSQLSRATVEGFRLDLPAVPSVAVPAQFEE